MSPDCPSHLAPLMPFMLVQPCIVGHLLQMQLRSGGVFVGTTFLRGSSPAFLRTLGQIARNYNYLTKEEIQDLSTSCGLIKYSCKIQ